MSAACFKISSHFKRAANGPQTGERHRRRAAFTLIEILIVVAILGILAGIVIPQFAGATQASKKTSLRNELQTLRAAVQLYRVQHKDTTPDLVGTNWAAFTGQTDINGNAVSGPGLVSGYNCFGPYMQVEPKNMLSESSSIAAAAGAGVGWVYNQSSGTVEATQDSSGTLFDESQPD